MSSVSDFGELSALIYQLHYHANQSKLLQKVVDDTRRVLREIRSASCVSQSMYQE